MLKQEERTREVKLENEKQTQKKFNKMYILREDRKNRVKRSEKIKEYNRKKLLDSINERFKKMEKIKRDKQNLDTERKIMQEQMRQKKQKMMYKFKILIHSDKFYKREEFYDYIFNNKPMPKGTTE